MTKILLHNYTQVDFEVKTRRVIHKLAVHTKMQLGWDL